MKNSRPLSRKALTFRRSNTVKTETLSHRVDHIKTMKPTWSQTPHMHFCFQLLLGIRLYFLYEHPPSGSSAPSDPPTPARCRPPQLILRREQSISAAPKCSDRCSDFNSGQSLILFDLFIVWHVLSSCLRQSVETFIHSVLFDLFFQTLKIWVFKITWRILFFIFQSWTNI